MKCAKIILLLAFSLPIYASGQDPVFTQTMTNPMYFNPAFAGMQQNLRSGIDHRIQWSSKYGVFLSTAFSADIGLPKINSGIGIIFTNDIHGYDINTLTTNTFTAVYSYEFNLTNDNYLRLGAGVSFSAGIAALVGIVGTIPPWDMEPIPQNPNLSIGTLYYRNNFYIGISAYNIVPNLNPIPPNDGYLPTYSRLNLQSGGFLNFGKIMINPHVDLLKQGNYEYIMPGLNLSLSAITIGASYRYAFEYISSLNMLLGVKIWNLKLCYSYDYTLSGSTYPGYSGNNYVKATAGSHELSIVFQFNKPHDTSSKPMIGNLRNAF